ncbi:MAG: hypothetical protein FJ308_23120 [Planctomycetes bacterium]|nr:hypothetical protein [Planctomycetota bacterium]
MNERNDDQMDPLKVRQAWLRFIEILAKAVADQIIDEQEAKINKKTCEETEKPRQPDSSDKPNDDFPIRA